MAKQETLWDKYLKPMFRLFINEEELRQLKNTIDWEKECQRLSKPEIVYPSYYRSHNFYGIQGGYLTEEAAVSYDPIVRYLLPPNETWVRQEAINIIGGQPSNILDLGCGTGSTTLMLKQTFPSAEVIGIDLSPYMLSMANYKSEKAQINIQWRQENAIKTSFPAASFDVVTAFLLFHETPPTIAQSILQECFRLLVPGGQVIIFDGNQKILRQTPWLIEMFEEPLIQAYATENVEAWISAAGFEAVQSYDIWVTNQVTRGIKPLPANRFIETVEQIEMVDAIPAF